MSIMGTKIITVRKYLSWDIHTDTTARRKATDARLKIMRSWMSTKDERKCSLVHKSETFGVKDR